MFLFKGVTPLMYAAQGGHLGIVKFLVTHGADVNVKFGLFGEFLILHSIVSREFVSHFYKDLLLI